MNSELKQLIRLQAVDLSIQELREKTEAFPAKSTALDEQLRVARDEVRSASDDIHVNQSKRKQLESQVTDIGAKISEYKNQLMAVKTNEEYKAMVKEINYNQLTIGKVEDEILTLMLNSEGLDEVLKVAEAKLSKDEQNVLAERSKLEELNASDTAALEANLAERRDVEREVSEDVLLNYDRVASARGGIALSKASDETCELCNVRMRPQKFQEVRKNDQIITCDNCNRVLYDPGNLDHPYEIA